MDGISIVPVTFRPQPVLCVLLCVFVLSWCGQSWEVMLPYSQGLDCVGRLACCSPRAFSVWERYWGGFTQLPERCCWGGRCASSGFTTTCRAYHDVPSMEVPGLKGTLLPFKLVYGPAPGLAPYMFCRDFSDVARAIFTL